MNRRLSVITFAAIGCALLFALLTALPSGVAYAAAPAQIPPRPTLTPQPAPPSDPQAPAPAPKREAPAAPTPTPWPMRMVELQPIEGVLPAQNTTVRYQNALAPQANGASARTAPALPPAQTGTAARLTAFAQNRTLLVSLLALDVIAITLVIRRRFFARS